MYEVVAYLFGVESTDLTQVLRNDQPAWNFASPASGQN